MLTPQQIESLSLTTEELMQPVVDFLIEDIARRVSKAGQFTSSAAYQIWRAQSLGVDRKTIEKELQKKLNISNAEVKKLLKQSAEVGYDFDMRGFGEKAIPFSENKSLQQIVEAALKMSNDTFKNITQTIGFVDPYGNAKGLTEAYQSSCDFAFNQVVTGATDYNTAIRNATRNLADKGILSIDYESGIHTSLEAAVRRNIMGGLGLMQEQISQQNHDAFGADGWEISAHSASAPDHEDIQGKQYTDEEFEALNNSLTRRIGTLNCGHAAFPIILGVSEPQYSEKQLERFKEENQKGVEYNGKHYTTYEATQKQRQLERAIRRQKRRVTVAEGSDDKDAQLISKAKLRRLNEEYKRYSDAVGLPLQRERTYIGKVGKVGKVVETKPIVEKKKPSFVPAKTTEETPSLTKTKNPRSLVTIEEIETKLAQLEQRMANSTDFSEWVEIEKEQAELESTKAKLLKEQETARTRKAVSEAEDKLKSGYFIDDADRFITQIDLSGCDAETAEAVVSAYDKVFEKFPSLRGKLSGITMSSDMPSVAMAETGYGGLVMINPKYFSDYNSLQGKCVGNFDAGNLVARNPEELIVHELGHAFSMYAKTDWTTDEGYSKMAGGGTVASQIKKAVFKECGTSDIDSVYSKTTDDEWFAEAFTLYCTDRADSDVMRSFGSQLEKISKRMNK
jgi:hypothetical protein